MCVKDGYVVIQNSEHLCGNLCKKTVGGGSKKGLFYSLIRDNTLEVAAACMLRLSKFSARWISNRGFSIGINDVAPFPMLVQKKAELLKECEAECDKLIEQYRDGTLELRPGCDLSQSLEAALNGRLGELRGGAAKLLHANLPRHNVVLTMGVGGSKGSDTNLSSMIACLG